MQANMGLSNGAGKVRIAWQTEADGNGGSNFLLDWDETGGPEISPPLRHGFGTTVIAKMPKYQFGADVQLDYGRSGFSWRLACPAEKILELSGVPANGRFGLAR